MSEHKIVHQNSSQQYNQLVEWVWYPRGHTWNSVWIRVTPHELWFLFLTQLPSIEGCADTSSLENIQFPLVLPADSTSASMHYTHASFLVALSLAELCFFNWAASVYFCYVDSRRHKVMKPSFVKNEESGLLWYDMSCTVHFSAGSESLNWLWYPCFCFFCHASHYLLQQYCHHDPLSWFKYQFYFINPQLYTS